jgi:hypothetical protein
MIFTLYEKENDDHILKASQFGKKEIHNLYFSPNITRVIKSGQMRWVGHVACMVK